MRTALEQACQSVFEYEAQQYDPLNGGDVLVGFMASIRAADVVYPFLRKMKKFVIQTVICTMVTSAVAVGLSYLRPGVFWRLLHEDFMILGMFGVVGGLISMFAGSGPIGRPERTTSEYNSSMGLILLLSGITNLAMSLLVFNYPRFFNSLG